MIDDKSSEENSRLQSPQERNVYSKSPARSFTPNHGQNYKLTGKISASSSPVVGLASNRFQSEEELGPLPPQVVAVPTIVQLSPVKYSSNNTNCSGSRPSSVQSSSILQPIGSGISSPVVIKDSSPFHPNNQISSHYLRVPSTSQRNRSPTLAGSQHLSPLSIPSGQSGNIGTSYDTSHDLLPREDVEVYLNHLDSSGRQAAVTNSTLSPIMSMSNTHYSMVNTEGQNMSYAQLNNAALPSYPMAYSSSSISGLSDTRGNRLISLQPATYIDPSTSTNNTFLPPMPNLTTSQISSSRSAYNAYNESYAYSSSPQGAHHVWPSVAGDEASAEGATYTNLGSLNDKKYFLTHDLMNSSGGGISHMASHGAPPTARTESALTLQLSRPPAVDTFVGMSSRGYGVATGGNSLYGDLNSKSGEQDMQTWNYTVLPDGRTIKGKIVLIVTIINCVFVFWFALNFFHLVE